MIVRNFQHHPSTNLRLRTNRVRNRRPLASAPLNTSDELDIAINRIISDQAPRFGVVASKRNLGFDVQREIGAAGRPNR